MGADKLKGLPHFVDGEACFYGRKVELAHQSVGNGVAVKDGVPLFERPRLEGVTYGMTQIERLSQGLFVRVELYNALFYLHRLRHHILQLL